MFLISIKLSKYVKKVISNPGMLKFVPNCYKIQKMCKKAVDCYSHA